MACAASDPDPIRDWPLWWFARLETAVDQGDFQTAAIAQRELERLGVVVRYKPRVRATEKPEVAHAAC